MEYTYINTDGCAAVAVMVPHTIADVKRAYFTVNDHRGMPLRTCTPHFEWDGIGDLGQVFGGGN
jgi:hypothetical protein